MVRVHLAGGVPAIALHIVVRVVRSGPARKIAMPTGPGSGWGVLIPPALSISSNSSSLVRRGKRRRRVARFGSTATTRSLPPSPIRRGGCAGWC